MTRVKICGITNVGDACAAAEAGADFIGLVLSESPRRISLASLRIVSSALNGKVALVGVFAEAVDLFSFGHDSEVDLDYYQVYFDYSDTAVRSPRLGWIRSFLITGVGQSLPKAASRLVLYDFKAAPDAMTSTIHETNSRYVRDKVILAGNLAPESVGSIVKDLKPFGVDVARGTERAPGIKEREKMQRFIESVRNAC